MVFVSDALLAASGTVPPSGRFASLPAMTVLFGPPTYLLGFVSPYAAESIVGAFLTMFILVPACASGPSAPISVCCWS